MLENEKLSLKVSNSTELEKKAFSLFNKRNNSYKIKRLKNIGQFILKKNLNELKKVIL